jgi:hypothetical protein
VERTETIFVQNQCPPNFAIALAFGLNTVPSQGTADEDWTKDGTGGRVLIAPKQRHSSSA